MRCPRCATDLEGLKGEHGFAYRCPSCSGEALAMAVVRKRVEPAAANAIWRGARGATRGAGPEAGTEGAPCPSCTRPLVPVALEQEAGSLDLDGCERCALIWFDVAELVRLPVRERPRPQAVRLTPEEAEAHVAMRMAAATSQGAFADPAVGGPAVEDGRRWRRLRSLRDGPWLSMSLALLLVGFYVWAWLAHSDTGATSPAARSAELVERYAFDADDPLREGGKTLVTSFLVGPARRISSANILLLVVAGYLFERRLGRLRFAGLLALGHGAALLAYVAVDMPRQAGLLGASGGLAALYGWGAVILGRVWMNERRLKGRWWSGWQGAGGDVGPLLVLGFGLWFLFTAAAAVLTPWDDLTSSRVGGGWGRSTPAGFVGGLLGLALGLATLRRAGAQAPEASGAARSER
jgi:Zn-finger nucleic acid-binding protein